MEGGREKKDGVTIFGLNNNNIENTFKPDFILNYNGQINYPYIFAVYYESDNKNYSLRGYSGKISDNRLLYIKLNEHYNLPLREKEIISAGNVVFQINLIQNNKIEITNLSKKIHLLDNKKVFDPNDTHEVNIGRDKMCNFCFKKDKAFSRIQTTFSFENNEWVIYDGNKFKSSTNGTWVFGTHSFFIKDQMIIEILNSKLKFIIKEKMG